MEKGFGWPWLFHSVRWSVPSPAWCEDGKARRRDSTALGQSCGLTVFRRSQGQQPCPAPVPQALPPYCIQDLSFCCPGPRCLHFPLRLWPLLCHGLCCAMASAALWPLLFHGLCCPMASAVTWPLLSHGLCCPMASIVSWLLLSHGLYCSMASAIL